MSIPAHTLATTIERKLNDTLSTFSPSASTESRTAALAYLNDVKRDLDNLYTAILEVDNAYCAMLLQDSTNVEVARARRLAGEARLIWMRVGDVYGKKVGEVEATGVEGNAIEEGGVQGDDVEGEHAEDTVVSFWGYITHFGTFVLRWVGTLLRLGI